MKVEEFCRIDKEAVIGKGAMIRSHTVIYKDNVIGNDFKTGHGVLIREGNEIGNNVVIGSHSIIEGYCKIEDNVIVHSNCYIGEETIIKKGVWIGPNCTTLLTLHPRCRHRHKCNQGPIIDQGAIIGAGTTLMPRIIIGKGAMIGAGSVVTKDIPPEMIAVGNPAKIIKKVLDIKCPFGEKYESK